MTHPVYFIGAGPGSIDHLTLGGSRALSLCATVFSVEPYASAFAPLLVGKTLLDPFAYRFEELIARMDAERQQAPVALLIPGDLTFYAPFQALIDALGDAAIVLPGVGTANLASARLKKTFDLPGVCNRAVLCSPRTLGDGPDAPTIRDLAAPGVTLLIYMNNIPLPQLVDDLRAGYKSNVPIAILHRLDLPEETIVTGTLETIVETVGERDFFNLTTGSKRPALTLVVVGETISAVVDGTWWNWRQEHIWRHPEVPEAD